MSEAVAVEGLLREAAPRALAALMRRHGAFDDCEDAVQEAVIVALARWPSEPPADPTAWLITVATRRLTDGWRSAGARRNREERTSVPSDLETHRSDDHDELTLFLLCCHPAVTRPSQVALTLRAVGGLTTSEIAAAFFVPETTMAQRISRAKAAIRASGSRFEMPEAEAVAERISTVTQVLYLIYTEGHTATSGEGLHRTDLAGEALRLSRRLCQLVPSDGEVRGLLALLLLTEARRNARLRGAVMIPLEDQDRMLWNRAMITEGTALLESTLGRHPVGPYQLQAAIAALHDEATVAADTDWRQILALYDVLQSIAPGPMVSLSRSVAVAHVRGPDAALPLVDAVEAQEPKLRHRTRAVRAHLLELSGRADLATTEYRRAAAAARTSLERAHLERRWMELSR